MFFKKLKNKGPLLGSLGQKLPKRALAVIIIAALSAVGVSYTIPPVVYQLIYEMINDVHVDVGDHVDVDEERIIKYLESVPNNLDPARKY